MILPKTPDLDRIFADSAWKTPLAGAASFGPTPPAMWAGAATLAASDMAEPLLALAHLAYGWMPRNLGGPSDWALDPRGRRIVADMRALASPQAAMDWLASATCPLRPAEGRVIQAPVNRSRVGTSKVFRFLAPTAFSIWDSVVARAFGVPKGRVNRRVHYRAYLGFTASHAAHPAVHSFARHCETAMGHAPTGPRALEFRLCCAMKGGRA